MAKKTRTQFSAALFHPRYWLTWIGFGLWYLLAQLPFAWQCQLAKGLAFAMRHLAKRRCHIATRNFEICFPSLTAQQREALLQENLYSTAMAFFETGIAWFWPRWRIKKILHLGDLRSLEAFQAQRQGAILLVLHFTTLELLGAGVCGAISNIDMTYRPHDNPVYDFLQHRRRGHHHVSSQVVAAGDVRSMAKSLRAGRFLSYFPDQDYGPKQSVFAPFFGIPAATVVGLARLASIGQAAVIPLMCVRRADNKGYDLQSMPAWENYPSGDDVKDAKRLNAHVEACIKQAPAQYLWVHRRFKTRPPGESSLY